MKTIIVLLMVMMLSTQSIADEPAPTSNFSIDNTLWHVRSIALAIPCLPFPVPLIYECGFHQGVLHCCNEADECSQRPITIIEMVFASMAIQWELTGDGFSITLMIIQPFGVGTVVQLVSYPPFIGFEI